jgi:hypothetical protein
MSAYRIAPIAERAAAVYRAHFLLDTPAREEAIVLPSASAGAV